MTNFDAIVLALTLLIIIIANYINLALMRRYVDAKVQLVLFQARQDAVTQRVVEKALWAEIGSADEEQE